MKIAVINFSGNVGKSTIAKHVLIPKLKGAQLFNVETINADEHDSAETLKGKQFSELSEAMTVIAGDAVVDIGASNVEEVLKFFAKSKGAHEDFDFFVVPVIPERKQMRDTISTIEALADIGVPAKKIRLVFNNIESDDSPRKVCSALFSYWESEKNFTLNENAVIPANDLFTTTRHKLPQPPIRKKSCALLNCLPLNVWQMASASRLM
jgi:MinD-like ATPase involved in chromosome partitioning or flagellar assembly